MTILPCPICKSTRDILIAQPYLSTTTSLRLSCSDHWRTFFHPDLNDAVTEWNEEVRRKQAAAPSEHDSDQAASPDRIDKLEDLMAKLPDALRSAIDEQTIPPKPRKAKRSHD
jgi:hypothetical protein